jgi:sentrin-specific protease 3
MDSDNNKIVNIHPNKYVVHGRYLIRARNIDYYMALIMQRSPNTVYVFKTLFFIDLYRKGYDGVKDFTEDIDIFSKQKLIIPLCLGEIIGELSQQLKWTLFYVNFPRKFIKFYNITDTDQGLEFLQLLKYYLIKEFIEKKKINNVFHLNDWSLENMKSCQQLNDPTDNSMRITRFAEFLSVV